MDLGEETRGLPQAAYFFIGGFIFVYLALSFLGAEMGLAAVGSGFVLIGTFVVLNLERIKSHFAFLPKEKTSKPKVIDAKVIPVEEIE